MLRRYQYHGDRPGRQKIGLNAGIVHRNPDHAGTSARDQLLGSGVTRRLDDGKRARTQQQVGGNMQRVLPSGCQDDLIRLDCDPAGGRQPTCDCPAQRRIAIQTVCPQTSAKMIEGVAHQRTPTSGRK